VEDGAIDLERLERGGPGPGRGEGGGGVPVRVGGEHGRLGAVVHAEDVRLTRLPTAGVGWRQRRRRERQQREEKEEGGERAARSRHDCE
jgi:hypothetical protein